ncbi:AAA family ATPase (plasmid) [Xanthomonas campestris pv. campestris]|uniref:AAA family ATPase n=1 Tax=Lysobacteraceae TaxID=32033 RepID=UPI002367CDD5|nr:MULTISPECIES: AAA family ATPase [Xanthomonadaceae]MDH0740984.1 AAA family ATPase [Stenotrophomonas maltophilia]MDH1328420.1 AAA family ATPase [Stenotrophomonas maltophilia]MEB1409511.1 AAA family ATPase [Xanthomonas campestris pv. campestris]MEB1509511.1 AAA family ATPase [Xanthomonas campestris pv. campestris]MEB1763523.1 AAA family ATPase [Xanthomonas campestris pv. campestris]
MSTTAEQSPTPSIGADYLVQLGDRIGQMVMRAKDFSHPSKLSPEQGESRRLSLREIADSIGVSHSTVNRVAANMMGPDAAGGTESPKSTGRTGYRYSLAEAVALRKAIAELPEIRKKAKLDRRRGAGEPCVTLGIMNFKGGVAKSTTTAHAGAYLSLHGYRTLVIDTDPQATLSTLFGIHPDIELSVEDTLLPYFEGSETSLDYCIRKTEIPTLDVIPSNVGLASADLVLPSRQRDMRQAGDLSWFYMKVLAEGIATIEKDYDVILIDCPPSMSYLTTVATQACDALLVPMRPSMPDFASSAQFIRMFGGFQREVDEVVGNAKEFDWIQVLITLGENNNASAEMEAIIRKAYGDLVMGEKFPYLTAVARAAKAMRTIYDVARADTDTRQLSKAMNIVNQLCQSIEARLLLTRARLTAQSNGDQGETEEAA